MEDAASTTSETDLGKTQLEFNVKIKARSEDTLNLRRHPFLISAENIGTDQTEYSELPHDARQTPAESIFTILSDFQCQWQPVSVTLRRRIQAQNECRPRSAVQESRETGALALDWAVGMRKRQCMRMLRNIL